MKIYKLQWLVKKNGRYSAMVSSVKDWHVIDEYTYDELKELLLDYGIVLTPLESWIETGVVDGTTYYDPDTQYSIRVTVKGVINFMGSD